MLKIHENWSLLFKQEEMNEAAKASEIIPDFLQSAETKLQSQEQILDLVKKTVEFLKSLAEYNNRATLVSLKLISSLYTKKKRWIREISDTLISTGFVCKYTAKMWCCVVVSGLHLAGVFAVFSLETRN